MRLLNTRTLELECFTTEKRPQYAMLSHTWGPDEVVFDDARHCASKLKACGKRGLSKVLKSTEVARKDGFDYIWIDTCCIDKSSSAELSEAINSMFDWYRHSHICYAFLEDYRHGATKLADSRWFTRGWTLQELIAPLDVEFYDANWTRFGDRLELSTQIAEITAIGLPVLRMAPRMSPYCADSRPDQDDIDHSISCSYCRSQAREESQRLLDSYSTCSKMSWASHRTTTRVEDVAYCLMGMFNVNMPLLYGEGMKAFRRLQEEIVRSTTDHTILIWGTTREALGWGNKSSILAKSPAQFVLGDCYQPIPPCISGSAMTIFNSGIELDVYLTPCTLGSSFQPSSLTILSLIGDKAGVVGGEWGIWLAVLNCHKVGDLLTSPALLLNRSTRSHHSYRRQLLQFPFEDFRHLTVSHGSPTAMVRGNPIVGKFWASIETPITPELVVHFDASKLKRTRILLHDYDDALRFNYPSAQFIFAPQVPGYAQIRYSPTLSEAGEALATSGQLPVQWKGDESMVQEPDRSTPRGSIKWVYGAMSASNGVDDGFFVLWGAQFTNDKVYPYGLDFYDWSSPESRLFVEIHPQRDQGLLSGHSPGAYEWITELVRVTQDGVGCTASGTPPSAACRRVWMASGGGTNMCAEARLERIEFVGRMVFRIDVSISLLPEDKIEDLIIL